MIEQRPNEDPVDYLYRLLDDEETMNEAIAREIEDNFAHGLNVYMADEKGIYQLFQDGSKKYVDHLVI